MQKMPDIELLSFWNEAALKRRYQEIGQKAFDRGFRQRAIIEGDLTFQHFSKCVRVGEIAPKHQICWSGVDLSTSTRPGTIITTVGKLDVLPQSFLIDIRAGAWSSPETAEQIQDINTKYKPQVIYVENNAYQTSLIEWLQTKNFKDIPIKAFTTTGSNKNSIEIGVKSLDVQFENGNWLFHVPSCEIGCKCVYCNFQREFKNHPLHSTTDYVMSFWFAALALKDYGSAGSWNDFETEKNVNIERLKW